MPDISTTDQVFSESSSPSNEESNGPASKSITIDGNPDNRNNDNNDSDSDAQQKLVLWQGITLLTADCMGVGILGLPNDMKLLGWAVGLSFLVLNCPVNYFAGNLLSNLALDIENKSKNTAINDDDANTTEIELSTSSNTAKIPSSAKTVRRKFSKKRQTYRGLTQTQRDGVIMEESDDAHRDGECDIVISNNDVDSHSKSINEENEFSEGAFQDEITRDEGFRVSSYSNNNHDRNTSDLINITRAIFSPIDSLTSQSCIMLVKIIYYVNLFLVLGDYILVMSRSVAAFFGEENICLPTAGAVASILMFGLCQFRTMANLGRSVSLASLIALLIVLVQCLFHHNQNSTGKSTDIQQTRILIGGDDTVEDNSDEDDGILGKLSSLAGIAFAVGSQKLFLNVRHELQHRDEASRVLAGSLFTYGSAYVAVVLLAGPDPPSFLFDSIPEGWGRKIAGLLLWFHVAVSYAINSQALCASLDAGLPTGSWFGRSNPAIRWFGITLTVSLSSYLVSNAIPFFKDLVALIGALTSIPLSLTLPAILYRKAKSVALLLPDRYCLSTDTYLLLLYSFVFLIIGLVGALSEIGEDWLSQGRPFACRS